MMSLYTKRIKLAYIINYIKTQSKLGVVMHAFKSHRSYEGNFCKCKKVEAGESLWVLGQSGINSKFQHSQGYVEKLSYKQTSRQATPKGKNNRE